MFFTEKCDPGNSLKKKLARREMRRKHTYIPPRNQRKKKGRGRLIPQLHSAQLAKERGGAVGKEGGRKGGERGGVTSMNSLVGRHLTGGEQGRRCFANSGSTVGGWTLGKQQGGGEAREIRFLFTHVYHSLGRRRGEDQKGVLDP